MKDIVTYINESSVSDVANKKADKFLVKYYSDNALEFKEKAEADNWEFDMSYNDWTAGDYATFKFNRGKETLFVTYILGRNSKYNGEPTDDELAQLNEIDTAEYYNK